jgi:hypothetical protein
MAQFFRENGVLLLGDQSLYEGSDDLSRGQGGKCDLPKSKDSVFVGLSQKPVQERATRSWVPDDENGPLHIDATVRGEKNVVEEKGDIIKKYTQGPSHRIIEEFLAYTERRQCRYKYSQLHFQFKEEHGARPYDAEWCDVVAAYSSDVVLPAAAFKMSL